MTLRERKIAFLKARAKRIAEAKKLTNGTNKVTKNIPEDFDVWGPKPASGDERKDSPNIKGRWNGEVAKHRATNAKSGAYKAPKQDNKDYKNMTEGTEENPIKKFLDSELRGY